MSNFTLEEIYLIKSCDSDDKSGVMKELKSYFKYVDSDMAEIINNALGKLSKLSDEAFADLRNYPKEV